MIHITELKARVESLERQLSEFKQEKQTAERRLGMEVRENAQFKRRILLLEEALEEMTKNRDMHNTSSRGNYDRCMKLEEALLSLPDTWEYRHATNREGPRAFEWADKPHCLVYDLCTGIEKAKAILNPTSGKTTTNE